MKTLLNFIAESMDAPEDIKARKDLIKALKSVGFAIKKSDKFEENLRNDLPKVKIDENNTIKDVITKMNKLGYYILGSSWHEDKAVAMGKISMESIKADQSIPDKFTPGSWTVVAFIKELENSVVSVHINSFIGTIKSGAKDEWKPYEDRKSEYLMIPTQNIVSYRRDEKADIIGTTKF